MERKNIFMGSATPKRNSTLVAVAVASVLAMTGHMSSARADEVSELKAAVEALQKRIDQLETKTKAAEDTNDHQSDLIAQTRTTVGGWVNNFTWKGDLRYRNENIVQEFAKDRNRDRIRVRTGFETRVNDTVRTEVAIATAEGNDPRSSNQTLTGENTRKAINLDVAYAEWAPNANWKFTAGKMRYPWVRPGQSVLFDGDVNPEGLAANFTYGDFFASSTYNILEERAALGESTLLSGQIGWKPHIGPGTLTVGASYFSFNSVQGRNPFFNAVSNGNTTTTQAAVCHLTVSPCLLYGYHLVEGLTEWAQPVAGRPLTLFADYIKNNDADNGLDTAYSLGFQYGRARDPGTWEIGYVYQNVEKDAVFAQFVDSDFGAGNTDAKGSIIKFGYAVAKNWVINGTYFLNKTNMDVPVTVAGHGAVLDRDYKRLQIDLNFKY
jgi:outer membrane murein-binding lipoprotein Lpp